MRIRGVSHAIPSPEHSLRKGVEMKRDDEIGLNRTTNANQSFTANEVEARFLRNQKARTDGISNISKHKKDELFSFWATFRENIKDWKSRLSACKLMPCLPTFNRQQAMNTLDEMVNELKMLQKNALAAEVELTATDLKLLHKEFATCRTEMEEVREIIYPSTRFVFKKYRAALREQRDVSNASVGDSVANFARTEPQSLELGRSVQNISNSEVNEEKDGSFTIESNGNISTLRRQTATSLVVQDLHNCKISL